MTAAGTGLLGPSSSTGLNSDPASVRLVRDKELICMGDGKRDMIWNVLFISNGAILTVSCSWGAMEAHRNLG